MVVPPPCRNASFSLKVSASTSLTVLIKSFLMAGFEAAFFADFLDFILTFDDFASIFGE